MKIFGSFLFWFFILLISLNLILLTYFYIDPSRFNSLTTLTSPVPKLLSKVLGKSVSADDNFWQPSLESKPAEQLELTALTALSYDLTTNTVLYQKEIDTKRPIASLTKIMTAIIALEHLNLSDSIKVSKSAAEIGEGTMGLSEGEILTVEEILYGLLLQSGNDAGETLAQTSKFGREGYLHLMNKKAEDMGLSNTRFTNPTGLQGDGEQYGTAKELLVLTRYALTIPKFAEIVSTYEYHLPQTDTHKAYDLYNETNLLTTYPGVKGVKTGFTDEAGMCLVTYLDYEGHKIIGVLLNSQNRRQEMKDLLDFSLTSLRITPPIYQPRL